MTGREAKHQKLANYADFSLAQGKMEGVLVGTYVPYLAEATKPTFGEVLQIKISVHPKRCYTREFSFCGLPKQQGVNTVSHL